MPSQNSYHQIHLGERRIIERLYTRGYKAARIAREIFRSRSTVTREIKRNGFALPDGSWQYTAEYAQRTYTIRMRIAPKIKRKEHPNTAKFEKPNFYLRRFTLFTKSRTNTSTKLLFRPWRWKKEPSEALLRWNESWQGKIWRSWYNSRRRKRCYRWEEMGRLSKQFKRRTSWRSPFSMVLRLKLTTPHFSPGDHNVRKKRKEQKRDRWRLTFMRRLKPWWYAQPLPQSRKKMAWYDHLFIPADSNQDLSTAQTKEPLTPPFISLPLISIAFYQLNRIAMSEGQLNSCISKIPIIFHRGSPYSFFKSA